MKDAMAAINNIIEASFFIQVGSKQSPPEKWTRTSNRSRLKSGYEPGFQTEKPTELQLLRRRFLLLLLAGNCVGDSFCCCSPATASEIPPLYCLGFFFLTCCDPLDKAYLEASDRMPRASTQCCCFLLCLITLQVICRADRNILNVGEELQKETLPLQSGSRVYQLEGLKLSTWYEVKISYPASIPASFSLQLGNSDLLLKPQRKLLNTEKLIFKNDLQNDQSGTYVMLTVEPEGVVAIPHGKEREMVVYNIVVDELVVGIPHKAWWVAIVAVVCLGVAFVIPSFLPSILMSTNRATSKNS